MPRSLEQFGEELLDLLKDKVSDEVLRKVKKLLLALKKLVYEEPAYGYYYSYYARPVMHALRSILEEAKVDIPQELELPFEERLLSEVELREARSPKGLDWEVIVLREGETVSRDKIFSRTAVEDAVRLLPGLKAYFDHPTRAEEVNRPERSVFDVAGWFENARLEDIDGKASAVAILRISASPGGLAFAASLKDAYERGKKDLYGISIRGVGMSDPRNPKLVTRISKLFSADIVTEPNAGGRFVKLLESIQVHGEPVNVDDMLSTVKEETKMEETRKAEGRKLEPVTRSTISSVYSSEDKVIDGLTALILGKTHYNNVPAFRSLREAFCLLTGADPFAGDTPWRMLRESAGYDSSVPLREAVTTTTSWSAILGSTMHRVMLEFYARESYLDDWRKVVSEVSSVNDFRTQRRLHLGGIGPLAVVSEGANFPEATVAPQEEVTFTPSVRGVLYPVTLQVMANDDVGVLRSLARRLAFAAKDALYREVFGVFSNNPTYTGDGTALFSAAHNNTNTLPLSSANLSASRNAMMAQVLRGTSTPAMITPKYIVVPMALKDLATKIVTSDVDVDSPTTFAPNPHKGQYDVIAVPIFTDTNDWFLVADPSQHPTLEVAFFGGKQEPDLVVASDEMAPDKLAGERIVYKVRHIWGLGILDYKTFYRNTVA
mgnify:CR=1 FL=1